MVDEVYQKWLKTGLISVSKESLIATRRFARSYLLLPLFFDSLPGERQGPTQEEDAEFERSLQEYADSLTEQKIEEYRRNMAQILENQCQALAQLKG